MSEPITYVGIDEHKAELLVMLLASGAAEPVVWMARNEIWRLHRVHRSLEG